MESRTPPPDDSAAEIDRLRLESQRLRIELAEARARESSLGETLRLAIRQAAGASRGVIRRALGRSRSRAGGAPSASPLPPPYVVRPAHPARSVRPRVVHVIANFHLGGSSRLVIDIVEALGHAYEQSVVSCDLPEVPAYVGVPIAHHPARSLVAARRVRASTRPDLLHVHYLGHHRDKYGARDWEWYRHWFAAAERESVPVIENINIPTEPYVSDAVACYVHVSDYVRERFGRRDGRHVTIYPGSDLSRFARPNGESAPDDCLGMVYRLARDKLDERAMEPFIEAIQLRPGTRALIVGGGVRLDEYRSRVAEAGLEHAFTFTGYVPYDALPALYRQMSVFVAPVHRESFGQVTPFAMGMALPVVGYDVGAIPEIIGDRSLVAPAGDSTRLARLAVDLLDDPARRAAVGAANRARAERLFSVDAMIAAYESLYAELATRDGTTPGKA
jgi:glycosyltransferase involved in cell wall biosynthesis